MLELLSILAVALCAPPSAVSPAEDEPFVYPDTPAGTRARTWFEAYAGGDDALRDFETRWRDPAVLEVQAVEGWLAFYAQVRAVAPELVPAEVVRSERLELEVVAASAAGGRFLLHFDVLEEEPHLLRGFSIVPASGGPDVTVHTDWTELGELVERVRADFGLPALVVATVEDGDVAQVVARGVRCAGADEAVRATDRFHVGSVTKSMTAMVVAKLVEQGELAWSDTVGERLPGVDVRPEYAGRTLEEVLHHRAGLGEYLGFEPSELERLNGLAGPPEEQRAAFLREVLAAPPATDGEFLYSNAGYTLLGHVAELAARKPWAALVEEHVFAPLGMQSAGFGWPRTAERAEGPCGHYGRGEDASPQEPGQYDVGAFIAPAGGAHASAGDLARFAAFHVAGLRGADGALQSATVRRLHTPPALGPPYAGGWFVESLEGGGTRHWHNGSLGTFHAYVELVPTGNRAVVVVMNAADPGDAASRTVTESIAARSSRE